MSASAMGERIAFMVQANRTLPGSSAMGASSAADVQHADQGEQAARGVVVELDPAGQRVAQDLRALVVQPRRAMSIASIRLGVAPLIALK
jgi:hypothetical protein